MKKYIEDTLNYYDKNSKTYFNEWNINFVNNFDFKSPDIFLSYLNKDSKILDLGCGSGRDILYFKNKGYNVNGIDGSKEMCELTSKLLGEKVEHLNFLDLNYKNEFDGIYACASLLHLNDEDLTLVLNKVADALKESGILYVDFKFGETERIKDGRFFNDMTKEKFEAICKNVSNLRIVYYWIDKIYDNHKVFINFILKKIN